MRASSPAYGDENRKKLGFNKSIIFNCKYNKKKCDDSLHWYWSYDYGNCWQYNSGFNLANQKVDLKNASLEGKDYGFSLVVYPLINRNKFMTTWDNGMIVFIHNSSFKPVSSDAVYVEPGKDA